jgi:excinuclease ABC subunit C
MEEAVARLDFEYAGRLRDRIDRLRDFQERLAAFRGRVESLTFLYRVTGFAGNDRLYLIRRGRIRREFAYPTSKRARARIAKAVEHVYRRTERGPAALKPREASEILLVARWFELRPKELERTATPEKWRSEEAIRFSRRRVAGKRAAARRSVSASITAPDAR